MRGKRAKAYSSRAMERNTPSTMRFRSWSVFSGYANVRFSIAVRRKRGNPTSRRREQKRAKPSGRLPSSHKTSLAMMYWIRLFYPTAAEHQIAIVENRALARRHGPLRLVESNLHARRIGAWKQRRRRRGVLVADL